MKKSNILIVCCVLLCACSSAPKKDLTSHAGVIAAYFNIHTAEYDKISELGIQEDDTLSLLIVTAATSLSIDDIVMRISSGYMTAESGLDAELIDSRLQKIKTELTKY